MDGGLTAAVWVSPPLHLRMDDFLSNRWGPPQSPTPEQGYIQEETFKNLSVAVANERNLLTKKLRSLWCQRSLPMLPGESWSLASSGLLSGKAEGERGRSYFRAHRR
jgi:hypothetical protein